MVLKVTSLVRVTLKVCFVVNLNSNYCSLKCQGSDISTADCFGLPSRRVIFGTVAGKKCVVARRFVLIGSSSVSIVFRFNRHGR